jgi:double-stranded uracil-DNA glycosylase
LPEAPVLPDLLKPGLTVVFCGTAAGTLSAKLGQYYANPQNKFWRTLHVTGLTPRLFAPHEYRELLTLGIGATDIAKHASGMDHNLPKDALGRTALDDLRARILVAKPKILAFTSLAGGRKFLGPKVRHGKQAEMLGDTAIWVLPSPSPVAQTAWNESVWHALAEDVAACRNGGVEHPERAS